MISDLELLERFPNTRFYDLAQFYSEFVPFTVNSIYPVHRWYRFKEGYSKDLVHLIVGSLDIRVDECLDPFAGSGTTPLACQEVGIQCRSIEVNPFLHHLAKTKLNTDYSLEEFDRAVAKVKDILKVCINNDFKEPVMSTITERTGIQKWLFNRPVLQSILALRCCLAELGPPYSDLLLTVLASILTDIGNTIKDGKCVRYKKKWHEAKFTRENVCDLFFERTNLFREDIQYIGEREWEVNNNADLCVAGSALRALPQLSENSVDAVITSPPYLNSFDYTDVYMPELWALGFVESYEDVRNLRARTLRSHVQVKWTTDESHLSDTVRSLIAKVTSSQGTLWSATIPSMIGGYFLDMRNILTELERVIRPGGKLCIVVGTSSYYKVAIPTDLLLASAAVDLGFEFEEMRIVRRLKRSTKQVTDKGKPLPLLRESILILTAPG